MKYLPQVLLYTAKIVFNRLSFQHLSQSFYFLYFTRFIISHLRLCRLILWTLPLHIHPLTTSAKEVLFLIRLVHQSAGLWINYWPDIPETWWNLVHLLISNKHKVQLWLIGMSTV